jgi:hypothetical protein
VTSAKGAKNQNKMRARSGTALVNFRHITPACPLIYAQFMPHTTTIFQSDLINVTFNFADGYRFEVNRVARLTLCLINALLHLAKLCSPNSLKQINFLLIVSS